MIKIRELFSKILWGSSTVVQRVVWVLGVRIGWSIRRKRISQGWEETEDWHTLYADHELGRLFCCCWCSITLVVCDQPWENRSTSTSSGRSRCWPNDGRRRFSLPWWTSPGTLPQVLPTHRIQHAEFSSIANVQKLNGNRLENAVNQQQLEKWKKLNSTWISTGFKRKELVAISTDLAPYLWGPWWQLHRWNHHRRRRCGCARPSRLRRRSARCREQRGLYSTRPAV